MEAKGNSIENYKKLISSSKAYIMYLETLGDNNRLGEECDIDSLKVGYATFALLLWKDEYIRKDQAKNLSTPLVDKMLEVYITNLAKKNDEGKWQIGEIVFDSNLDVVDKVRNKLAHGDFIISNHDVYFEINGQRGFIKVTDLVAFATHLGNDWEKMRQYGENTTNVFRNLNITNGLNITTPEDLDTAIDNISYIEIKDKPKILVRRTLEYLQMAYFLKDKVMKEVQRGHEVETITQNQNAKRLLDSVGMSATITEIPASEMENVDKVKGMYLARLSYLQLMGPYYQQKYLTHWLYESARSEMTKKNICYGLLSSQVYLQELEKDPTKDVSNLVQSSPYGETLTIMNEKTIISSYLASFYFTYIYGLDNILNTVNREYLPDILEGKTFDFSRLDLSSINPQMMVIEHDYPEFQDQIDKLKSDLVSLTEKYQKVKENYDKVSTIPGKEQIASELENLLKDIQRRQEEIKELVRQCEYFMKSHYEPYKWNRSIIEHIRNSIAHGNVFLNIFHGNYTTAEAQIKFQDIHEQKKSFELELTAGEFNSMMEEKNVNTILHFLGEEEKPKSDVFKSFPIK